MFLDEATIRARAGSGGSGAVSFRREKHVPRGGPEGGDGGRGGSVVLVADPGLTTLVDFRHRRDFRAGNGGDGSGNQRGGKNGEDVAVPVPVGTVVTGAETGEQVADLVHAGQREVIARGGRGGRGNMHFVNSVHQTPRFAEKGEPGEERLLRLDLKLLADVGLIGFPNVGKSTLIARISAAKPKIADYPFTTLVPNLGVVSVDVGRSFVVADIPGLIEGAHQGAGLGHQFLRHVERTRLLVHLLDVSGMTGRDPWEDYRIIRSELAAYSNRLAELPELVALNKTDLPDSQATVRELLPKLEAEGLEARAISAVTGLGVPELVYSVARRLDDLPREVVPPAAAETRFTARPAEEPWSTERDVEGNYIVLGKGVERLVAMTDLENESAVRRMQRILDRMGVVRELREMGAHDGDTVRIGTAEFDFLD